MSDTLINILGLTIGWGLIALGALLILRALFADRSRGRRRCPRCWYSMQGIPSLTCPECGRTARKERRLFKTRRRYRRALAASFLPVLGLAALYASGAARVGWVRALPTTALVALCPIKLADWDSSNTPLKQVPLPPGMVLPTFPATNPGPPLPLPPPSSGDWRQDVVDELRSRVEGDSLWDWQAALLAGRIQQAAAADGLTIGVHNSRGVLDSDLISAGSLDQRAILEKLGYSFPFRDSEFRSRGPQHLALFISNRSQTFVPNNTATVIGPFVLTWNQATTKAFKQLFAAMRSARAGKPAPCDPKDWEARAAVLERARASRVNAPSDRRLSVFFDDLANQSGLRITPDWESLEWAGVTGDLVVRTPFEPTGSVVDLLDRCFEAAERERGYVMHWSVGPDAITIGAKSPFHPSDSIPTTPITRVYDTRLFPPPELLDWRMQALEFNGRLIISADMETHIAFEAYLMDLPFR